MDKEIWIKRNRGSNFTKEEEILLVDEIAKYKHIIECKTMTKASKAERNAAWSTVANNFNEVNTVYRPENQLRIKYDNLKLIARKKAAGAPSTSKMDVITEKVLSLVNTKNVIGVNNPPYDGDTSETRDSSNTTLLMESQENEEIENEPVELVYSSSDENIELNSDVEIENISKKRKWDNYMPANVRTLKSKELRRASIIKSNQNTDKKEDYYAMRIKIMEEALKIMKRKEERAEEKHEKEMMLLDIELKIKQKNLDL